MPLSQSKHECYLSYVIKYNTMQTQPTFDNANHYRRFQIIKQLFKTYIWEKLSYSVWGQEKSKCLWSLLASFLAPPSSFLLFVIGKLEWTKTNCYYFQHLHQLLFYILLGRYISACQTNRHYFYKMNRLLYTDSHWCQFLMHPVYWDILYNGHHILFKTYQNNQICVLS